LKIKQHLYLFFNEARPDVVCTKCNADLSFDPKKDQRPPLMMTRKTKPYCIDCAYRIGIATDIGICKNKTSSKGNHGH